MYSFLRLRVRRALSLFRSRCSSAFSSSVKYFLFKYLPRALDGRPGMLGHNNEIASPMDFAFSTRSKSAPLSMRDNGSGNMSYLLRPLPSPSSSPLDDESVSSSCSSSSTAAVAAAAFFRGAACFTRCCCMAILYLYVSRPCLFAACFSRLPRRPPCHTCHADTPTRRALFLMGLGN